MSIWIPEWSKDQLSMKWDGFQKLFKQNILLSIETNALTGDVSRKDANFTHEWGGDGKTDSGKIVVMASVAGCEYCTFTQKIKILK